MNRPHGVLLMATLLVWWWSRVGASRLRGSPVRPTVRQNQQIIPQEEEAHYRFEIIIEQWVDVPEDGTEDDVDVEPDPQHLICIEKSIMEEMPYIAQRYLERETSLSKKETSAGWGGVDKVTYKPPDGDGKVISVKNTGDGEKVFVSGSWTQDTETQDEPTLTTDTGEGNTVDLKRSSDYNATRDDENALRKMLMHMTGRGLDSDDNSGSGPGDSGAPPTDEEETSDGGINIGFETPKTASQTITAVAGDDTSESESSEEETSDGGVNEGGEASKTTPSLINVVASDDNSESESSKEETSDGEIELQGAGINAQGSKTKPPQTKKAKKKKKKKKKKKAKKRWKGVFRIRTSCKFCDPDNLDNSRRALQDAEGKSLEHNHNARVPEKEEEHTSKKTVEEENVPKVVDEGTKKTTDRIDDTGNADFQSREKVPSLVGDGTKETTKGIDDTGNVDFQSWMNVYLAEQVKADCEMANTKETRFWFVDNKT